MSKHAARCNTVPCKLGDEEAFVFISYGHSDADVVFPIIDGISAKGYKVWYDAGIHISSIWTDEIANAILTCKIFILFVTKDSILSPYVRSEIEFALNNRQRVIPVYLDSMSVLPPGLMMGLSMMQGITNVEDPAEIVAQICKALEYNEIEKEGEVKDVKIQYKKYEIDQQEKKEKKEPYTKARSLRLKACAALFLLFLLFLIAAYFSRPKEMKDVSKIPTNNEPPGAVGANPGESRGKTYTPNVAPDEPSRGAGAFDAVRKNSESLNPDASPEKELARSVLESGKIPTRTDAVTQKSIECITLDRSAYTPGGTITVKVSGFPKAALEDGPFVGVYEPGAEQFLSSSRIYNSSESLELKAPLEKGEYEVRAYAKEGVASNLVGQVWFSVR
jgi:hypothetical protein